MRILIWSTAPWVKTGYGKNCNYFIRALHENHEVDVLATYGLVGGSIQLGKVRVFPTNNDFYTMGEWLKLYTNMTQPDLIIQHFDIWVIRENFISENEYPCPLVTYTPVDSEPCPPQTVASAQGAHDNVAMTQFTQQSFHAASMPSTAYIPHCVNHEIYYPENKSMAKQALGIPQDTFLIGSIATNKGPRKNIVGQLQAFKKFITQNKEAAKQARFYLHCYPQVDTFNQEGFDLPEVISYLGLSDHIYFTNNDTYKLGLDESSMRTLYSAFDVLSECSLGEGFGIPIIEAQACGTPVIVTDFSAMPEVLGAGGTKVPIAEYVTWQKLGVRHALPSTDGIAEAYESYFTSPRAKTDLAIENAQNYSFERWKKEWNDYVTSCIS